MWGIIPAAGKGSRIQPLAFSKELLPVGSQMKKGIERPRAVSDYLIEKMIAAGATKICFIISPGKSDIMEYYGSGLAPVHFCYTIQQEPRGLCDAIFRALPLIHDEDNVLIGLPDTIWFPEDGFSRLPDHVLSFLLFPVSHPEFFDAVLTREDNLIQEIRVKKFNPGTPWVWGAFKMPGRIMHELYHIWRIQKDEYIGDLVNRYIQNGGKALGIPLGESYIDVGTLNGYRKAIHLLSERQIHESSPLTEQTI